MSRQHALLRYLHKSCEPLLNFQRLQGLDSTIHVAPQTVNLRLVCRIQQCVAFSLCPLSTSNMQVAFRDEVISLGTQCSNCIGICIRHWYTIPTGAITVPSTLYSLHRQHMTHVSHRQAVMPPAPDQSQDIQPLLVVRSRILLTKFWTKFNTRGSCLRAAQGPTGICRMF